MLKSFRFRIYPNKNQIKIFETWLHLCCDLYNVGLEDRKKYYEKYRIGKSNYDQQKELHQLKLELEEYKLIHSQVLQNVLDRLDKAYQNFFRMVKNGEKPGYPRFKSKRRYDSFTYPQNANGAFRINGNNLHLSKIGEIKIRKHREIEGRIKTCTISRTSTDKWFVSFACEVELKFLEPTNQQIGIDVGLESFATYSDGSKTSNPRFFKLYEEKLSKAQQKLEKLPKDTHQRIKQKLIIARVHEKIANKRKDFAHKLSRKIINNFDFIAVEDLESKRMSEGNWRSMNRGIRNVAWSQFFNFLSYKAEWAGRQLVKVNPKNTSQMCSQCGELVPKDLSVRVHDCPYCGLILDRDHNAARNILWLGTSLQTTN